MLDGKIPSMSTMSANQRENVMIIYPVSKWEIPRPSSASGYFLSVRKNVSNKVCILSKIPSWKLGVKPLSKNTEG